MTPVRAIIAGSLLCLLFAQHAKAESQLSFLIEFSTWTATDIVVVDAEFRAVEIWKGALTVGAALPLQHWNLTAEADVDYRRWDEAGRERPKGAVGRVSGQRRVLFLICDAKKPASDPTAWQPASIGRDADTCAVWLEKGGAYAIRDTGESARMGMLGWSAQRLRDEVAQIVELRRSFTSASQEADLELRAKKVIPFLEVDHYLARDEALEILIECGDAAWPDVRKQILDEGKLPVHPLLIHALRKVDGKKSIPLIEQIVMEETRYWRTLGEVERRSGSYTSPMHTHYSRLSSCMFVLKHLKYKDGEKRLIETLRDEWETIPSLAHLGGAGDKGRSPILQWADEILRRQ